MTRTPRLFALPAALLTTGALLTACGGSSTEASDPMPSPTRSLATPTITAGAPAAGPRNDSDTAFSTGMVSHHAQAIEMADLVAGHATASPLTRLAARIKAAQAPEIAQMSAWLAGWGVPVPNASTGGMDHDMGSMNGADDDPANGMAGMMSEPQMADLASKSGVEFEKTWLRLMIRHHEGAVESAKKELADGANADVKKFAQRIIDSQTSEIMTMRDLLAG